MATNTKSLDLESGSTQYAQIADAAQTGLDITTAVTMECWVKVESFPGTWSAVLMKGNCTDFRSNYRIALNSNGSILMQYYGANPGYHNFTTTATGLIGTGTYYHIAGVYTFATAASAHIYVDGVEKAGTWTYGNGTANAVTNADPFIIGASAGDLFDGLVDEVRIWNLIRTGTEIANNKGDQIDPTTSGLVAYYRLNDSGLDETTNNNDLTLYNTPVYSTTVPFSGTYPSATTSRLQHLSLLGVG
jgi:hypothetical protein